MAPHSHAPSARLPWVLLLLVLLAEALAGSPMAAAQGNQSDYRSARYIDAASRLAPWEQQAPAGSAGPLDSLSALGNSLVALGEFSRAANCYGALVSAATGTHWPLCVHDKLTALQVSSGRAEDAIKSEAAALNALFPLVFGNPDHPRVTAALERIAQLQRLAEPGLSLDESARRLVDQHPHTPLSRILSRKVGCRLWDAGQKDDALRYFKNCLSGPEIDMETLSNRAGTAYIPANDTQTVQTAVSAVAAPEDRERLFLGFADLPADEPHAFYTAHQRLITADGLDDDWEGTRVIAMDRNVFIYGGSRHGLKDLSAYVRLSWSADSLNVYARVRDDRHEQPHGKPEDMWKADSIQIGIAPERLESYDIEDGEKAAEVGYALHNDGRALTSFWGRLLDAASPEPGQFAIRREDAYTLYEVCIPWQKTIGVKDVTPGMKIRFDIAVNDSDQGNRDCWMEWRPGITEIKSPVWFGLVEITE